MECFFESNKKPEEEESKSSLSQSLSQSLDEEIFKLPICFNPQVKILKKDIISDLELNKTIESTDFETKYSEASELKETSKPIYSHVFNPTNSLGNKILEILPSYYTTDTSFLKDNQTLLTSLSPKIIDKIIDDHKLTNFEIEETITAWNEIKSETGFCEKYLYVDWDFAKFLNNNPVFLQLMSIYNVASPMLSLCLPIFVLIVPFFVIKFKGLDVNIKEYTEILRDLIQNHAVAKIFTSFHEVDFSEKIYLLVSAAFYLFSIYQNILTCIRFYSNMKKIHDYLDKFKKYILFTTDLMDYHLIKSNNLSTFSKFNETVLKNKEILHKIKKEIEKVSSFTFSFSKITEIGHIMYVFYQLFDNIEYNNAFVYSFGFNGYYNLLHGLTVNIGDLKLNKATFKKKDRKDKKNKKDKKDKKDKTVPDKPIFKKMYYPKFINDIGVVTNDCCLDKNMIITGPNASGKTTMLKSAFINILLSQQIGFGCFESLDFYPYDDFHCYLNIPDTSGRDSLFQAEARQCKEIIDRINERDEENKDLGDKTHFCIFDELYSGTNPDEAILSAKSFLQYLIKNDNVTCLLTTHYTMLCKRLAKNKRIQNFSMKTEKKNDNFEYTYKLVEGISKIKGGLKVLKDMNYPKEILSAF
jgi:hypothetical protein